MSRLSRILYVLAAAGALATATTAVQAEGAFAQLYAARPPAGSSFVRVVNPGTGPLRVKIADGVQQTLAGTQIASTYAIVKGNTSFSVVLDGKAATLQVGPDTVTTLVPKREGSHVSLAAINDVGVTQDALKADLRFYNLTGNCASGQLDVSPAGQSLFLNIPPGMAAGRAINPVSATLEAVCGSSHSAPYTLPTLQPGDHYSLFLTGSATRPALRGQPSETDPYQQ
ncbi:alginate O-acetyltransferase AlgF [Burkholderia anthina]|uniref:alginate O-acetyltransferase AlgF n=1 Tax=Burkholderia anthina TaxID=179879 RepID=UPI001FC8648C|nr:alginate O-acetyltransferase AlgF [Burkholderia anthina]